MPAPCPCRPSTIICASTCSPTASSTSSVRCPSAEGRPGNRRFRPAAVTARTSLITQGATDETAGDRGAAECARGDRRPAGGGGGDRHVEDGGRKDRQGGIRGRDLRPGRQALRQDHAPHPAER